MSGTPTFVELFFGDLEAAVAARGQAADLGWEPVSTGAGAALTFLAAVAGTNGAGARSVVEIGTGAGVSALYLFAGMSPDGVLTSIDPEAEHQRVARAAIAQAGISLTRARLITGRAAEVLPRLTDGAYDLVVLDGARTDYPANLPEAIRLLRRGGVLVLTHALAAGNVADPTRRDPDTVALRECAKAIRDNEDLVATFMPLGSGLLAAVKER